jgi:hypothetical protein
MTNNTSTDYTSLVYALIVLVVMLAVAWLIWVNRHKILSAGKHATTSVTKVLKYG